MKYTALTLSAVLVFAAACVDDEKLPFAPDTKPVADIADGAHEGNLHFYFLPPMVDQPSYSGTFDGSLAPVVEICIWDGSQCRAGLEIYNMETGPGAETARVVPEEEHYIVNWHTDDILTNFPLQEGEHYRIRVLVGLQVLGFADLTVVNSGKDLRNVDTDEFIPLLDGRTLPIKFRIEEGALVSGEIVSAGENHSCAVDASGTAYCWGYNWAGELGTGNFADSPTPVPVTGGHTFQSVSAGYFHTCGVTTDGDAYCWGMNWQGQLGIGYTSFWSATPVAVNGGHKFQSVSAGSHHTCGVTPDGDAYCWGYNGYGQLGIGPISEYLYPTPVLVTGGHVFQSVSTTHYHTCGLATDGAFCWGHNYYGQLGDGTDWTTGDTYKPSPTAVAGGPFQSLDAGAAHSCGVTIGGDAYCWGLNRYGQIGDGSFTQTSPWDKPNPTKVVGGLSFEQVNAGQLHSCAVAASGAAYCWGYNVHGQLGDGTTTGYPYNGKSSPVEVDGGHKFQSVSAGWYHSCGATETNDAYCWGFNGYGQIGDGSTADRHSPVFVLGLDPPTP